MGKQWKQWLTLFLAEGTTRRGTATPVHRPQRPAHWDLVGREKVEGFADWSGAGTQLCGAHRVPEPAASGMDETSPLVSPERAQPPDYTFPSGSNAHFPQVPGGAVRVAAAAGPVPSPPANTLNYLIFTPILGSRNYCYPYCAERKNR